MKPVFFAGLLAAPLSHGAITFSLNFIDAAGQTWDDVSRAVVEQEANEWGSLFVNDYFIDVDVTFAGAGTGGYLGQWSGTRSWFGGEDLRPWSTGPSNTGVSHVLSFNADLINNPSGPDLWFDPTPHEDSDILGNLDRWDALTVARHEFGHLMGFTSRGFYVDNVATPSEVDLWGNLLTDTPTLVFDAGGLNVSMFSDSHPSNFGVSTNDLMVASLSNGTRREISDLNLEMLTLAYGYELIPEPSVGITLLGTIGLAFGFLRRRR